MREQLELFPDLPLGLRPPRGLRVLGFELERIRRVVVDISALERRIDDGEADLAAVVAEARAVSYVPPRAYGFVVEFEEMREELAEDLRILDEAHRTLDNELAKRIERHLKRGKTSPSISG